MVTLAMSENIEQSDITPSATLRTIRNTVKGARKHLVLFGWLLIAAVSVKFAANYFTASKDFDHQIDRIVIVVGFFILLIGSIYREISRIRKEKYANIGAITHAINHTIRDLTTYITQIDVVNQGQAELTQVQLLVQNQLIFILDKVTDLFSMVTNTTCRASIKRIHDPGDGKLYVYTLARDNVSGRLNRQRDKNRFEKLQDSLEENEDFYSIFGESKTYFFCNDLLRRTHYRNSSFKVYGKRPDNLRIWQTFVSSLWWTLPYRSTIVWPIQQLESDKLSFESRGCIGFLTVDSEFRNVFQKRFDVSIGAGVSDVLFIALDRYRTFETAISKRQEEINGYAKREPKNSDSH